MKHRNHTKKQPRTFSINKKNFLISLGVTCAVMAMVLVLSSKNQQKAPVISSAGPLSQYQYDYTTRDIRISLSAKSGKPEVSLRSGLFGLTFMPVEQKETRVASELKDKKVLFSPEGKDYHYEYSAIEGGVKENIVLHKYLPDTFQFKFTLGMQNLVPQTKGDNGLDFVDPQTKKVQYSMLPLFMRDTNGAESLNVRYELQGEKGSQSIIIIPDAAWLASADRKYPVMIDPTVVKGSGPVLSLNFDEGVDNQCSGGVNDACDTSGNSNNGAKTGAAWATEDMCVSGKCMKFDGTNDDVAVANHASLNIGDGSNLTVSAWVKLNTLASTQTIVAKKTSTAAGDAGYILTFNSSSSIFELRVADGTDQFIINSRVVASTSAWLHVAGVYDDASATNSTIYINGVEAKASTTGNIANVNSPSNAISLEIGTQGNGNADLNGFVDGVRVYNYARTALQVRQDYAARGGVMGTAAQFGPDSNRALSDGLIGYWKMDEASGDTTDSSGNGNTLANGGSTTFVTGKFGNGSEHVPGSSQHFSYSSGSVNTYYFNATDSGPTDIDACFSTPSNAFDGSTSTYTYNVNAYGCDLLGTGTNAPTSGAAITAVRARMYGCHSTGSALGNINYSGVGLGNIGVTSIQFDCSSVGWGSYGTLSTPSGGWTWQKVNDLEVMFTTDNNGRVYRAEVEVTSGSGGSLPPTNSISFWTNPDATTNYYASLTSGASITSTNGTLSANGLSNAKIYVNGTLSNTIIADSWQHVVVTFDSIVPTQFYIGRQGNNYFDGTMDEVRLYHRVLSPSEILQLYKWAPGPILYFNLDENKGTSSVNDRGTGLTATMNTSMTPSAWVPGKFGAALSFDGVDDYLEENGANVPTITRYITTSAWVKFNQLSSSKGTDQRIIRKVCAGALCAQNSSFVLELDPASNQVKFYIHTASSFLYARTGSNVVVPGIWYYLTGVYDQNGIHVYINGVDSTQYQDTNPSADLAWDTGNVRVGAHAADASALDGALDEVKLYNYARTPAQIIEDMNGGHPVGGSPVGSQVGYWKFDEGYGTTAHDSSPQRKDATLTTNASFSTVGKFGKALYTNGTGTNTTASHAFIAQDSYDTLSEGSVSFWFRPSDSGDDFQDIFSSNASTGGFGNTYEIGYMRSTDTLEVWVYFSSTTQINASFPVLGSQTAWHHAVYTVEPTGNKMYIDGRQVTGTYTNGSASSNYFYDDTATGTTNYSIGCVYDDSGCYDNELYEGYLDELKVYPAAMTADQVKLEYNRGSMAVMGSTGTTSTGIADDSTDRSYCPPGDTIANCAPALEWRLDEGIGITANSSINSTYNGTLVNGPTWATGKSGKGVNFDGNDDLIGTGNVFNPTSAFSVSMWVYLRTTSTDDTFLSSSTSEGSLFAWYISNGVTNTMSYCNNGVCSNTAVSLDNVLVDNAWQHLTLTYDGAGNIVFYVNGKNVNSADSVTGETSDTGNKIIGNFDTTNAYGIDGIIDDVKMYSYARSPAQVAWDFNRGAPAGWWKINECTGTDIHNYAKNANGTSEGMHGVLTVGGAGQTGTGTCTANANTAWYNGRNGKYDASINLDGDDYVTITDPGALSSLDFKAADQFTVSAWINPNTMAASNEYDSIFSKTGAGGNGYYMQIQGNGALEFCTWTTSSGGDCYTTDDTPVVTEQWQHILFTWTAGTGSTARWYYNGVEYAGAWNGAGGSQVADPDDAAANIGSSGGIGEAFDGKIDDIQLYRYTPTAAQIRTNMMENSAVHFGP